MNNRIAGALPLRRWVALAICLSFATADAAEPPIRLTIADSQVQALGIQTQPLSPSSGAVTARFAAEVTLPPQAARRISAPLAGMVTELLVQPDQAVRAGDPLLRLVGPQWGALQSDLLQADARARLARQSLQREQALFAEGIIPQRRLQEAQTALAESEAVLGQARMALQATGLPMALVEQLLSAAKPQQNLTLTAPTAGRVSQIEVQPGQQVEAADALLQLTVGCRSTPFPTSRVVDPGQVFRCHIMKAPRHDSTQVRRSRGAHHRADRTGDARHPAQQDPALGHQVCDRRCHHRLRGWHRHLLGAPAGERAPGNVARDLPPGITGGWRRSPRRSARCSCSPSRAGAVADGAAQSARLGDPAGAAHGAGRGRRECAGRGVRVFEVVPDRCAGAAA
jgi:biotin carboxyl carrier protein